MRIVAVGSCESPMGLQVIIHHGQVHWDWDPMGFVGPNANLVGRGSFNFVAVGSRQSKNILQVPGFRQCCRSILTELG